MFDTNGSLLNNFCLLYLAICKVLCGCKQNFIVFIFGRAFQTIFVFAVVVMTVATSFGQSAKAGHGFFEDKGHLIDNNVPRLSYGVAVSDFNNDGDYEFVVTGFKYPNLLIGFKNGKYKNLISDKKFALPKRSTIGVAACDIDGDGFEELYFLNTDTYSGNKQFSDSLLDANKGFFDLFKLDKNSKNLNLTAGRSVACVDRNGNGRYGVYVSNYGGPSRLYELQDGLLMDAAPYVGSNLTTGGRSVVSGHILSERMDIFAGNERGPNFLFTNKSGMFEQKSVEYGIDDTLQNARGAALSDILYRGNLDIILGNWNGFHRIYVKKGNSFLDFSNDNFRKPSQIRTVISADFDNDGYDEIFLNNIGQPNKLFKVLDDGSLIEIELIAAKEAEGLGTGAAVADLNNDGILEILVAHGESAPQPLSLFSAKVKSQSRYLRVKPINLNNAPARGATVILHSNMRQHAKTIDSGSGYLCQMEPIAHYGLREGEVISHITIKWTNGEETKHQIEELNTVYTIGQTEK